MQWPKGCRRCGGDLILQWDGQWSFVACVSCGIVKVEQGQPALAALRSDGMRSAGPRNALPDSSARGGDLGE